MNILILNWKDIKNPQAGGAELVIHELAKRLTKEGHKVTFLTSRFPSSPIKEKIDGISIIRVGNNRYIHPFKAINYYKRHLKGKNDIIIECINTAPYLINLFKAREEVFLFYHQLARNIWFYETKFPVNIIGWLLEPAYTFLQSRFNSKVITVSQSSKRDLMKFGFKPELINIITQGTNINNQTPPTQDEHRRLCANRISHCAVLYFGSLRSMKRPIHALHAFSLVADRHSGIGNNVSHMDQRTAKNEQRSPNCEIRIAGSGPDKEINRLKKFVNDNNLKDKVKFFGKVDEKTKIKLLKEAFVLIVPSLKEGWGLVVTEAAKFGTPSIVYDVDGLRDSVINNKTGYIVKNKNYKELAKKIKFLKDNPKVYLNMSKSCIENSKLNTFENAYADFKKIIFKGV